MDMNMESNAPEGNGYSYDYGNGSSSSNSNSNSNSNSSNSNSKNTNVFMVLSLVMGILAICSSAFIFGALVAGGMGILFAILSKGKELKMQFMPKIGIITSIAGVFFSVIITAAMFFFLFGNEENREQFMTMYNEMYEEMYGESFEDALKEVYPYMETE